MMSWDILHLNGKLNHKLVYLNPDARYLSVIANFMPGSTEALQKVLSCY